MMKMYGSGCVLSKAEWDEVLVCGVSLTLLLPQDAEGCLGHHAQKIRVPKNGLTTLQLLTEIAAFYHVSSPCFKVKLFSACLLYTELSCMHTNSHDFLGCFLSCIYSLSVA